MPDEFVKKEVFDARMDRLRETAASRSDIADRPDATLPSGACMPGRLASMEALLEKTLTEMKMDNEKLRSELKADNEKLRSEVGTAISELKADNEKLHSEMNELRSEVRSEIRMLDTRVDTLGSRIDTVQTTVYWGFAIIAIVLAFLPIPYRAQAIQDWRRMFHKPAVTMEDVERAISAAIAQVRLEGK